MSTLEFNRQLLSIRQQLYYFALGLTKDRDDALDLLQESLLRAITFRDMFRESTNFKAWVFTIAKNTFINGHRRNTRKRQVLESADRERVAVTLARTSASSESLIVRDELQRSLSELDETFRKPFLMHHEGFKYHEIAEQMQIPVGTVKSRIHQARQRLQSMLTDLPRSRE